MRKFVAGLLGALLLMGIALFWYAQSPMQTGVLYPLAFSIPQGASFKMAVREMAHRGALKHAWLFALVARFQGKTGDIKAGGYALQQAVTPLALLRKITEGDTVQGKITVIEGWTFAEMRRALERAPDLRHDTADMSDTELLAALGAKANHPEGLFFPDTYFFDMGSSDLTLYKRAYQAMQSVLEENWAGRDAGLPYHTAREALIMASIIEKETGAAEERPQIAAVFINRLRIGMRLQTDPSVIYGLGERYDGNLRRVDLESDTPYNSYTRAGLPPTPIALPGADAIHAAVHPDKSRALYFVAMGNGRHVFSSNLADHNRAVARYQKRN